MRSLRICGCWLTLTLGFACGGSKTASPADAGWSSQGGAGGSGAGEAGIAGTGGDPGAGGTAGTDGVDVPDASAAEGGSTTAGGTGGTGGAATTDSLSSGGRTSVPQDALDAPVDIALRPDAGHADDAKSDTKPSDAGPPSDTGPNRCVTLHIGLGRASQDAIMVDVDGDGWLDLVTAEADSHLAIYRQTAARIFAEPDVYDWPGQMYGSAVAAADLNQDGVLDFVMADEFGRTGLLLSAPGGARQITALSTGISADHYDVAVADFDRDGHLDIVVPVYEYDTLGFWWASGPGTFLPRADQATCISPAQISVIDANEDGLPDLLVACSDGASRIHINKGDRTFASTTLYQTARVSAIATGDTNRDGHVDLMLADATYRKVMILLGVASGVSGYHFHQYHRTPGAHPVILRHGFAQRSKARA